MSAPSPPKPEKGKDTMDSSEDKPSAPLLSFKDTIDALSSTMKQCFEGEAEFEKLEAVFTGLDSCDLDNKKTAFDQIFREYLTRHLLEPGKTVDIAACKRYIKFSIQVARKNFCSTVTPIQTLCDMIDVLTLSDSEQLFKVVEQEVDTWREPIFFTSCKNLLLRICNDLLKRLSRTQNTVFCGRILLFLAKFFPFSERSALNVISEFNLDNHTTYSDRPPKRPQKEEKVEKTEIKEESAEDKDKEDAKGEDTEEILILDTTDQVEEKAEKTTREKLNEVLDEELRNLAVDEEYEVYSKFWQIQEYFRNPVQCYDKAAWKTFSSSLTDILSIFQRNKLSHAEKQKKSDDEDVVESAMDIDVDESILEPKAADHQYFAKYLTNQNLFQLQLSDSNFRRYILVQSLILFQYLQATVKFKTEKQVLTTEQSKWVDDQRRKVFKLLGETPPHGSEFVTSVKHLLKRELVWITWKNEGCPAVTAKKEGGDQFTGAKAKSGVKRKAKLGDLMKREVAEKRVNLGNKGLTKLWSMNPDNLESCRADERDFLPSLENYFEDAILEIDPANQVEDAYKKVNNGEWGWRALRLMSRRSPHFFISGNNPISKLPMYLELMLGKMAKDMPHLAKSQQNGSMEVDDSSKEDFNGEDTNGDSKPLQVTAEQVAVLAEKLKEHWKALIPKLGLPDDKVDEIKKLDGDVLICKGLIECWQTTEGEGATQDEMKYILGGLKIEHLTEGVF